MAFLDKIFTKIASYKSGSAGDKDSHIYYSILECSSVISFKSWKVFTTFAGMPTANEYGGMSSVTTAPAPTTLHSPMLTPCKIVAFAQIQQFFPIITGEWVRPYFLKRRLCGSGFALVIIVTPYAIAVLQPISILSYATNKAP